MQMPGRLVIFAQNSWKFANGAKISPNSTLIFEVELIFVQPSK
jgi:FKBP-type peptidyl-prolyl cis-trans isomerase